MTEDSGVVAAYRGFLFADLRGYTAYGETHGDRAAADLLDAYRTLVREAVAQYAGGEIRTEGDSFYVVFASARDAVACGLAIVDAARRHSGEHPDAPLKIGIGINAGETVQRGEAFVGTAVNLAARLCSEARAGEVLVTATVREVARGGSDLKFVPRGVKRFKGIADRVPVFAVAGARAQDGRPRGATRPSTGWLAIPIAVVAVAAAGAAIQGGWLGGIGIAESTPPPQSGELPRAESQESGSPGPSLGEYPNPEEQALLSRLDATMENYCTRADPDDRPRLNVDRALAGLGGTGLTRVQIPITAGLECAIPSSSAPSELHYWGTTNFLDFDAVGLAEALVISDVGSFTIPQGDCDAERPAYGPWAFGGVGGTLLCRSSFGDAILEWTYDGLPLIAIATRRDGDADRLLQWWRDEARFLRGS